MSAGLILVIVMIAIAAVGGAVRWLWCRRHPRPLRGDWWSAFEDDFRQWAATHQPRERHRRSSRRDAL